MGGCGKHSSRAGGISLVARASGVSRRAIALGLAELKKKPVRSPRTRLPIVGTLFLCDRLLPLQGHGSASGSHPQPEPFLYYKKHRSSGK
jgi:hypothetical protein